MKELFEKLSEAMGELQEETVLQLTREAIMADEGCSMEIVNAMNGGMAVVGERFDSFEYFVGDLIFAGEIFTEVLEILKPYLKESNREISIQDKVILCTVEGDFHDIGKNIVKYIFQAHDMDVIDLGVNVSPGEIVRRTIEEKVTVIALSAVLTSAIGAMKATVQAFQSAGIRDGIHILIGGACASPDVAKTVGADEYGRTPEESADICKKWLAAEKGLGC